jgi:hypothetical protein
MLATILDVIDDLFTANEVIAKPETPDWEAGALGRRLGSATGLLVAASLGGRW